MGEEKKMSRNILILLEKDSLDEKVVLPADQDLTQETKRLENLGMMIII
jgi:hypothetical protein